MNRTRTAFSIALVLAAARVPARAQGPGLTDLHFLPGDTAVGPAIGIQSEPQIAAGGGQYLAVWSDHRTDRNSVTIYADESASDIYATRLDAAGRPLDVPSVALTTAAGDQAMPRVAWNGTNWLAAWTTQVQTPSYWIIGVQAVRVAPDGSLLDPAPITVLTTHNSTSVSSLAIASDGQDWIIVAQGTQGGDSDVVGARVSAQGTVLDPTPVVLLAATSLLDTVDIAYASGVYMLQWSDWVGTDWAVRARRFNPNLTALGGVFMVGNTSLNDVNPHVVSNGTQFLSVWEANSSNTQQTQIRAARVTSAGSVLDPGGLSVSGEIGPATVRTPNAAWDGSQWWVTWAYPNIYLARVGAAGQVLDPGGFPIDGSASNFRNGPRIAGGASGGAQVVWADLPPVGPDPWDVDAVAVSSGGQVGTPRAIALSKPAQLSADVAASDHGYAVSFLSALSGSRRVVLQRIDAVGNALDAQPIEISSDPVDASPALAWNGSIYMVVWERNSSILARRVAVDGTVLDAAPIAVMPGKSPDVAALGSTFLVTGTHAPSNPQFRFVYCVRVDASGAVTGSPLSIGGSFALDPRVTTLGGRWLVGWQHHPTHDDPHAHVHGAFVDAGGASFGEFEVFGPPAAYLAQVRLASSGANAMFLWHQGQNQPSEDVFAKRVLPDGTLLDGGNGIAVSSAAREQIDPAVGWDGVQYIAAYQDRRNDTFFLDNRSDVFGTRVGAGGNVIDPAGFAIEADPVPEIQPALDALDRRTLIAVSIFRIAGFGSYRIGLRVSDADCPDPAAYCSSLPNSSGQTAAIGSTGVASFSLNDLTLTCSGMPATSQGLFYFGTTAVDPGVPYGNGLRCVGGTLRRLPMIPIAGGTVGQLQDLHSSVFSGIAPGSTRYFQFRFRDTAAGGALFNSSDGLAVTFCD